MTYKEELLEQIDAELSKFLASRVALAAGALGPPTPIMGIAPNKSPINIACDSQGRLKTA